MKITKCNMCGEDFDPCDDFHIDYRFGYGSKYDDDELNLDLCNHCLDKVVDYIAANSKFNPITVR